MTFIKKFFAKRREVESSNSNAMMHSKYYSNTTFPHVDSYQILMSCDQTMIEGVEKMEERKEKKRGLIKKIVKVFARRKKTVDQVKDEKTMESEKITSYDVIETTSTPVATSSPSDALAEMEKRFEQFKTQMAEERQRFLEYQSLLEDRLHRLGRRLTRRDAELNERIDWVEEGRSHRPSDKFEPIDVIMMSPREYNKMVAEYEELKRIEGDPMTSCSVSPVPSVLLTPLPDDV